jgi:mannose-6-phosphate isomerase-like protein (cupin superfamily)
MKPYSANIEKQTLDNDAFRRALFTGAKMQLVVMCLRPGEEIGQEVHEDTDQFFRVEQGRARFEMDGQNLEAAADEVVIVPAGTRHNVINTSSTEDLKLYTLYAPPNHPEGTLQQTKAEADAAHLQHA